MNQNHDHRNNGAGDQGKPLLSRTLQQTLNAGDGKYVNVYLTARYYPRRIALTLKLTEQVVVGRTTSMNGDAFVWLRGRKSVVKALNRWISKHELPEAVYSEIDAVVMDMWARLKPIVITEVRPRVAAAA